MTGLYSIQRLLYYGMHTESFYKLLSSLFTFSDLRRVSFLVGKAERIRLSLFNMHVTFDPYNFKKDE